MNYKSYANISSIAYSSNSDQYAFLDLYNAFLSELLMCPNVKYEKEVHKSVWTVSAFCQKSYIFQIFDG